ncbi:integrin beta-1-binding protein 1 isoform X2 [Electrophorus electricus]|uniref:integrin beta-1-binding protein 1 isoform X2 n=1 Tax=Electrophorus electricus TaxID=8005 RepID=UPI0015D087E2|nr:integrin beta-1-binding protein 1 isoform X2 [Electrophorus electricus]
MSWTSSGRWLDPIVCWNTGCPECWRHGEECSGRSRSVTAAAAPKAARSAPRSVDSSLGGLSRSSTVASLDTDSTKSSGNSASEACAEFRVKYVGCIEKLHFEMSKTLQEPLDLISYIDAAQQDGKLPFVPGEEEMILGVSKYGVKVASLDQCDVLHRHPLYLVVRMLCYDDGLGAGKNLLALSTTDVKQQECSIWVYQCSSAEHAQAICKVLSASFDCALASEKS